MKLRPEDRSSHSRRSSRSQRRRSRNAPGVFSNCRRFDNRACLRNALNYPALYPASNKAKRRGRHVIISARKRLCFFASKRLSPTLDQPRGMRRFNRELLNRICDLSPQDHKSASRIARRSTAFTNAAAELSLRTTHEIDRFIDCRRSGNAREKTQSDTDPSRNASRTGKSRLSTARFAKCSISLSSRNCQRSAEHQFVTATHDPAAAFWVHRQRAEPKRTRLLRLREICRNAARRARLACLCFAKTIANLHVHAIDEVARREPLSCFRLDFKQPQR